MIGFLVDVTRIGVSAEHVFGNPQQVPWGLVAVATGGAFIGASVGKVAIEAVTIEGIQRLVAALLALVGVGVAAGLL